MAVDQVRGAISARLPSSAAERRLIRDQRARGPGRRELGEAVAIEPIEPGAPGVDVVGAGGPGRDAEVLGRDPAVQEQRRAGAVAEAALAEVRPQRAAGIDVVEEAAHHRVVGGVVAAGGMQAGIETACVGKGTCGLCRGKIVDGAAHLTPSGDEETRHLGNVYHLTRVRLACRARLTGGEVVVELAPRRKPKTSRREPLSSYPPRSRTRMGAARIFVTVATGYTVA